MLATWLGAASPAMATLPIETLHVPPGFQIEVLTDEMPSAREMVISPAGTLYVGSRAGKVYAMSLQKPDAPVHVVASGLQQPVGVAWRDSSLYVSAVSRIVRLDGIDKRLDNPPEPVVVNDKLPTETHHGWKFIAFGPDGKLYVPVGAPCNICHPDENRYANLMRMNADGSGLELVARGIRNTVGFDWHPKTHELWFTDNGRDMMGDDVPDDELNRITAPNPPKDNLICDRAKVEEILGVRPQQVVDVMALRGDDTMVGNHRSHGHPIGKGSPLGPLMAELVGKATGVCGGKGGSLHLADFQVGSLGESGIVGSSMLPSPRPAGAGSLVVATLRFVQPTDHGTGHHHQVPATECPHLLPHRGRQ